MEKATPTDRRAAIAFIRGHTAVDAPPLVPEIRLHLATEVTPLWEATEDFLHRQGLPPPFWAFAWAGGQALARWVLDHPEAVRARRVLVFAAGCGVDAIACARSGAAAVEANEIDPFALAALDLNAALNGVTLEPLPGDVVGRMDTRWDVVVAGDVCYERPMAERVVTWLRALAADGRTVLLADPGRAYFPKGGLERLGEYAVPTPHDLEGQEVRHTGVWRVLGEPDAA